MKRGRSTENSFQTNCRFIYSKLTARFIFGLPYTSLARKALSIRFRYLLHNSTQQEDKFYRASQSSHIFTLEDPMKIQTEWNQLYARNMSWRAQRKEEEKEEEQQQQQHQMPYPIRWGRLHGSPNAVMLD